MNNSSSSEHDSNFFDIKSQDLEEYDADKDYKKIFSERRKKTELSKMIEKNKGKITENIKYTTQLYKLNEIKGSKFLSHQEETLATTAVKDRLYTMLKKKKAIPKKNFLPSSKDKNSLSFTFISHLSCNRSTENYFYNSKNAENSKVSFQSQNQKITLNKTNEIKILNCLIFLKRNILLAMNAMNSMSFISTPIKVNFKTENDQNVTRRKAFLLG